jgi:hypothetical protein
VLEQAAVPVRRLDDEAQKRKLLEPPSINQIGDHMAPDIVVENHGSIFLLRPISHSGRAWIEQNIGEQDGFQPYWPTVVVEPRYVADILKGVQADDLGVSL